MSNFTERGEKPKAKDPTGWVTIGIYAVLMAIIIAAVMYALYRDIKAPQVVQRCVPGLCKFNVFSGVKTCPNPGDTVGVQLLEGNEFCTSANYCQQPKYQCAVNLDQTLNCDGECDHPDCRCVANPALGLVGI